MVNDSMQSWHWFCQFWDRINEYMSKNISQSLITGPPYCSAIFIFNCSMQLRFTVTLRTECNHRHRLGDCLSIGTLNPPSPTLSPPLASMSVPSGVKTLSADGPGEERECQEMSSVKLAWPSAKGIACGTGGQPLSYINHIVLPTKACVRLEMLRACTGRRQEGKAEPFWKGGGFQRRKVGVG